MKKMNKMILSLMAAFMLIGVVLIANDAKAAGTITFPSERSVFQRNDDNVADVTVKVSGDAAVVKARVMSGDTEVVGWTEISDNEGVIESVPAGGWYTLEVSFDDDVVKINKFGVGEVFVTGGQSNSANFGGAKTNAANDEISTLNPSTGKWQECKDSQPCTSDFNTGNGGGSPWPSFGDALYEEIGVPIGIICTGRGSAMISELNGNMYSYVKKGLDLIKPYGCRGFLIHQGEADTDKTDRDQYVNNYKELIEKSREEMGYDLNWFIARVSYAWSNYNNKTKQESMVAAQVSVCNNYNIFVGPTTDDLLGDYRHTDNLHLSQKGLIEHGKRWAEVVNRCVLTPYKLEADGIEHGKIDQVGEDLYASRGITLTATPDKGYKLVPDSIKVTDENGEEIELDNNGFVMRAANLKVTAEFEPLPQHFADLNTKIEEAKKVDATQYENTSIEALNKAIAAAEAVYANPDATEAETAKAKADVEAAVKGLIIKKAAPPIPGTSDGAATPGANDGANAPAVNDTVVKGGIKYLVVSKNTVCVAGLVKKSVKSVTIPTSIKVDGTTYKVAGINAKAFNGAKKLTKIVIKSTTIKKIVKGAFKGINAKAKIKVPKKSYNAYKKLIKKAGFKKVANIVK